MLYISGVAAAVKVSLPTERVKQCVKIRVSDKKSTLLSLFALYEHIGSLNLSDVDISQLELLMDFSLRPRHCRLQAHMHKLNIMQTSLSHVRMLPRLQNISCKSTFSAARIPNLCMRDSRKQWYESHEKRILKLLKFNKNYISTNNRQWGKLLFEYLDLKA